MSHCRWQTQPHFPYSPRSQPAVSLGQKLERLMLNLEGSQDAPPQNMPEYLACGWLWVVGTWTTANARRGFLGTPLICFKTEPPEGTAWLRIPSLEFHQPEETRIGYHTERLCHKLSYFPSVLLRVHSSCLKIIFSPLRGPHHLPFSY